MNKIECDLHRGVVLDDLPVGTISQTMENFSLKLMNLPFIQIWIWNTFAAKPKMAVVRQ